MLFFIIWLTLEAHGFYIQYVVMFFSHEYQTPCQVLEPIIAHESQSLPTPDLTSYQQRGTAGNT